MTLEHRCDIDTFLLKQECRMSMSRVLRIMQTIADKNTLGAGFNAAAPLFQEIGRCPDCLSLALFIAAGLAVEGYRADKLTDDQLTVELNQQLRAITGGEV